MHNSLVRVIVPAVIGVLIGAGGVTYLHRNDVTAAAGSGAAVAGGGDEAADGLTGLRADVARLKVNAPSQSSEITGPVSGSPPKKRTGRWRCSTSRKLATTSCGRSG